MDKFLPRKRAIVETIADRLTPYSPNIGSPSTSGDGNHAPSSGDFDVVAPDCTFIVGSLQLHVAHRATARLIIEDNATTPAFQVDSGYGARRAPEGECGPTATKPDGDQASGLRELDAKHASCPLASSSRRSRLPSSVVTSDPLPRITICQGMAVLNEVTFKGATLKNVSFAPPLSLSKKYYSHQDH
jgi:hypothetical protein